MRMLRDMRDNLRDMRTCHELGQWLQHYLDGEIESGLAARVEEHLESCVRCGLEFDTYARIKSSLHDASTSRDVVIEDEVALARLRRFADELASGRTGESEGPR